MATCTLSPLLLKLGEPLRELASLRRGSGDRLGEQQDPVTEATLAEGGQAGNVGLGVGGEDDADGGDVPGSKAPPAQDNVDQGASDAAVAVREGMDSLELSVGDRRLDEGHQVRPVHERDEILHEVLHALGRRGDEVSAAGVVCVPANRVLAIPELAGDLRRRRREHQDAMDLEDVLQPKRLGLGAERDRALHREDVPQHGAGGLVAGVGRLGLGAGEAALGQDQPLDSEEATDSARRRRRARTSKLARRGDNGSGHRWCARRQRPRKHGGGQRELQVHDPVGDERSVAEGAALRPASGGGRVGRP